MRSPGSLRRVRTLVRCSLRPGTPATAHLGENIPVEAEDIEGLVSLSARTDRRPGRRGP